MNTHCNVMWTALHNQSVICVLFTQLVCAAVDNFTTVVCNIHSQLKQYTNYKQQLRLAEVTNIQSATI